MLRETFTDGSLTNTPATTLNPVWDNPKQNTLKLLEDGNRVWNRTFASGYDYIGDQNWTDYSASVDVCFLKECDPQLANRVKLYVRHMDIDATGYYDYAAALENGNSIALYRRWRTQDGLDIHGEKLISVTVPNYLGDDTFHNLRVDVVDNVLKVYWDGSLKINYIDNGELKINLKGCVGLMTDETAVYLDNLTVVKLEDFFGGDYDNDIGGNFDQPIPDYIIKEYANSSLPY